MTNSDKTKDIQSAVNEIRRRLQNGGDKMIPQTADKYGVKESTLEMYINHKN